jgi:hypothetical protein
MSHLPIPEIDKLPTQISPCPIVEAILEVRFVSSIYNHHIAAIHYCLLYFYSKLFLIFSSQT